MKIHITKKGETLYQVAHRYQIDINVLFSHNQHIQDPTNLHEGMQIKIPSIIGLEGLMVDELDGKGNVCAYVADEPVQYKKLDIQHWPSQDYTQPINGTHYQHKDFEQAPIYPQYPHYGQHPPQQAVHELHQRYQAPYYQPNHWGY
ncbi:hypothetical protein BKP35_08135 [Anaerobacillus arseniciselenatis]|uniref:LysM domain-containing protein n=1 Tax=Anaerobacillus arseniciselenatis TaxID=85682 RepID=A0A1S2LRZ4_9BACI|nr:LysM domain-containing protein [Anaerobacillus arseniciselenatis]OIJ14155.1 hypothetical protein BKP35_08135 [Anaerobacillus arseniciselenatis]